MNFSTFYFIIFILFLSLTLGTSFFPEIVTNIKNLSGFTKDFELNFIQLFAFISSVFSYIGWIGSYYLEKKEEKKRKDKIERERHNMNKIHAELDALHKS